MEIKNLSNTSLDIIIECMNQAFKNYFVKIPSDVDFWAKRYQAARVDYKMCFGVFDHDELVAFIIQGIDIHNNKKTAFNTGTGVLETYRGKQLVDQLYEYAIPKMKKNGIEKCMLEVIDENHRAIRVYERIGFQKDRFLNCFKGDITDLGHKSTNQSIDISSLKDSISKYQKLYSWDNSMDAILKGENQFSAYKVTDESYQDIGYFVLNQKSNSIIQIEAYESENWNLVIDALRKITPTTRINNVDSKREDLVEAFSKAGLENHVNQFEMSFLL